MKFIRLLKEKFNFCVIIFLMCIYVYIVCIYFKFILLSCLIESIGIVYINNIIFILCVFIVCICRNENKRNKMKKYEKEKEYMIFL